MSADTARGALAEVAPTPGVSKPDPILVVEGVRKSFGGLVAVDVDHLEIQRGVVTALIGPNGAGKTTFFNLMSGFDRADAGRWWFDGRELSNWPAYRVARHGIVRTFQLTKALARMSVLDNMKLGARGNPGERLLPSLLPMLWRGHEGRAEERAEQLLARFQLDHMRDEYGGTLSGGQRKLLEMARALMTDPRLVMLDEPVAGVNPALTAPLLQHVTTLPAEGMTVLFVEHDMDIVMDISDWVVCMAAGRIIAEGPPATIGTNRDVIDAYLGTEHGEAADDAGPDAARPDPARDRTEDNQ